MAHLKPSGFIKSAQTKTSVSQTRLDLMKLLDRYGGTGFGYEIRGADIVVTFYIETLRTAAGGQLPSTWSAKVAASR
jgi:hypothetical protein